MAQSSIVVADFDALPATTGWLNVTGIICCLLLLLSYIVLPADKTNRHYLSVGLVISLCLIQVYRFESDRGHLMLMIKVGLHHSFGCKTGRVLRRGYAK